MRPIHSFCRFGKYAHAARESESPKTNRHPLMKRGDPVKNNPGIHQVLVAAGVLICGLLMGCQFIINFFTFFPDRTDLIPNMDAQKEWKP